MVEKKKIRGMYLSLPVNTWIRLKKRANIMNLSQSALVKVAVDEYLDKIDLRKKEMGKGESEYLE